ncbi:unnamed protein product [Bursaphelenchus xylophilus]|uniref:(pine wood nematode) hypothetical protein n=1 Tax=Bursaphelenchus xylophilus TaxID=6326 RepID=A0A1I7SRN1_BURXY|nr:unnamed protein product [Bursaphelenchus xylophilus]CAG9102095.1 unnamed protein product [Bursaphelenchus xylophilus]
MSPEAFSVCCYIIGAISVFLNGLTVYLIISQSTSDIRGYRVYLLNFTITDLIFSILLSFLLQPIPVIPGGGALIAGLTKYTGNGYAGHCVFSLIALVFAHSIVSLNYCFIYRFASLMDVRAKQMLEKRWYKSLLIGSGEMICFGIAMLIYDMRVEDEVFRNNTIVRFPYQEHLFDGAVWYGYDYKESPHANIFLVTALTLAPLSCGYNFLCAFIIVAKLHYHRRRLTQRTYNLHLKLMLALLIQTTAPLVLFITPISYVFASAFFLVKGALTNETIRYLPVLALALHPIINPLVTIFFIAPYRNAILGRIPSKRRAPVPRSLSQSHSTCNLYYNP